MTSFMRIRCGWSGEQANSIIYWQPRDSQTRRDLTNPHDAEVAVVRQYLENTIECRRY